MIPEEQVTDLSTMRADALKTKTISSSRVHRGMAKEYERRARGFEARRASRGYARLTW
jgi:hypothetical protein